MTHSKGFTQDQIDDLRKARRRHKNRRYQKVLADVCSWVSYPRPYALSYALSAWSSASLTQSPSQGARNRHRERRERGVEPPPATPAKLRLQVESLQGSVSQLQALCHDMMAMLHASNPQGLAQLREKHAQLFPK